MDMPLPDAAILARKGRIVARLRAVLPADAVIEDEAEVRVYECDALSAYRCPPMVAVLPRTTAEVSAVLRICWEEGVPVVPRGSGTSLAGGALPTADCVILGVARMNGVLETDYDNRFIRVQSGRTNLSVTGAVEPACLCDCRQYRDEFGRGALPEIRGDDEQPSGCHAGADGRHGAGDRRTVV